MMAKIIINCNCIEFIPVNQISSISGTDITPITDKSMLILKTDSCEISEKQKHTEHGDVVDQSLSLNYKESTQILQNFLRIPVVLKITRNNGDEILFGNINNPAIVDSSDVMVNGGNVKFIRRSTSYEYILQKETQFS